MQLLCQFDNTDMVSWKADFDAHAEDRGAAGLTQLQIWQNAEIDNRILVLFEVHNHEKAAAWVKSQSAVGQMTAQFLKDGMTPELTALALAALLQTVQFALFAIPANMELGTGYTSSARDRPPSRDLSVRTARLQRAMNNHFEGLILFTIAVVTVTLSQQSTGFTAICAWTYLAARILYIPAYALGWRPWRSAIWGIGFFATILMILATLF